MEEHLDSERALDHDSNQDDKVDFGSVKTKSEQAIDASQDVEDMEMGYQEELRKIHRKIDKRILPWLCITYLVMRIDLNNISNAAILNEEQGDDIKTQLGLSAQDWAWAIACFYYPYGFLEPFSTLCIKSMRPSFWLGRIMLTWGIIVCCISAVQNYAGLISTRVLLGAAEAGYYPGVIYYLAFWFRPEDLALRVAVFYSFGQVSGFVGGFLAFAVSFANGILPGWRWLFIIEGIPAILMGLATFYILPDFPQTATFLHEHERAVIIQRLAKASDGGAGAPSKMARTWDPDQVFRLIFRDPTFWTFSATWFCHAVGGFGLSYVLPTVIFELGFTTTALSNVLSMPPSLATFVLLNILGWLVQMRKWNPYRVAVGLELINIICYTLLLTVNSTTIRYLALLISTATAGSVYPILWPNRVKAAHGTTAAAIAIGVTNALAQFSGILGPQVFLSVYGPTYRVSFIVCIGLLAGAVVFIALSGALLGELFSSGDADTGVSSSLPDDS
ncbi:major facilitator superfamily domain-containing protein [Lentinula raphanica]|uniref:Major facilitator superfamily domain-containing protein n=1 Tax=Lentinula raphanica TaxID=153919 RepID=A0AA38UIZ8_9AGAR|nr:major facilitator superfamily domain-containing protein [Lentinula raphanica]KAJ3976633.1 major facilitator superfamily domain-containing protein [Lentinula raphanica]